MIVEIRTSSAAFADNGYEEVSRILRELADKIDKEHSLYHKLKDSNGNTVGYSKP